MFYFGLMPPGSSADIFIEMFVARNTNINFAQFSLLYTNLYRCLGFDINTSANLGKNYATITNNGTTAYLQTIRLDETNGELPATYHIFGNTNPASVSIVVSTGVNRTEWVVFGKLAKIHDNAYVGGEFLLGGMQAVATPVFQTATINDTTLSGLPPPNSFCSSCLVGRNSTATTLAAGQQHGGRGRRAGLQRTEWRPEFFKCAGQDRRSRIDRTGRRSRGVQRAVQAGDLGVGGPYHGLCVIQ